MTRRPYPTRAAFAADAAKIKRAREQGRICPACRWNIAEFLTKAAGASADASSDSPDAAPSPTETKTPPLREGQ